ncbi:serine/threonine protein phosphatase PrpC [Tibeticola sediminis]|jgi:serine/threonine protein phosphatase PrpC|uniref:Serine/threonine protein phosphatase PrpC n=1 Tax=Tibeticola sediminis TaxID=1917811 RepID=A0A3N4U3I3_9BURK|nr:protein phosphatase 2C domain-containing protein [Tibeticola sediminis]RPE65012.1 serine/threonine protein phosphatase PrpC [Tibeticola sediminis]
MMFSVFQVSRKGGRERNEDRMGYCYTRDAALFALADGMGGHPEGEVAAQLALQTVSSLFQRQARPTVDDPHAFLTHALMAAHHQIVRYAGDKGMLDTPRTTLVAALLQDGHAFWIHCGDSRLYVVRDGQLLTRTRDHSFAEHPAASESLGGPPTANRNILFTCLGSPVRPIFDHGGPLRLLQGDRLLLCSDGLWGTLPEEAIVAGVAQAPVAEAVPDLVERALRAGGARCDNVTAIAFEWETPGAAESAFGVSTDSISDGVFASTIQAGPADASADELDDAAIERSIAEINEAIRRSAARRG